MKLYGGLFCSSYRYHGNNNYRIDFENRSELREVFKPMMLLNDIVDLLKTHQIKHTIHKQGSLF